MSEATDQLTQAFWGHPELRRTAQLAIAEIDVLAAQKDACLAVCRAYVADYEDTFIDPDEMTGESKDLYIVAQAAIALCEQEKPNDDHPNEPPLSDHRKKIEGRLPTRERTQKIIDMQAAGGHPDDCTSVRLDSLRPGAILSTVTGWRGIKDEAGLCCSYDDGSVVSFDGATPCWEIRLGGWPPRNALPRSAEPE